MHMKTILTYCLILASASIFGQVENWPPDSLRDVEADIVTVYTKEYLNKYNRMKRIIVKVYPYALHAADMIDEIDKNAESINRRGKKNRFFKHAYKDLKQDFKYFILDLYTSEGVMLMKLIHRETGMTVYDISRKYRGKSKAEMFNLMAKIWDQDLHVQFQPNDGDDKIAEQVISDIQSGLVPFNNEIVKVDKLTFRDKKKKEREWKKKNKKNKKEYDKRRKKRNKEKMKLAKKKRRG
ncbi:MAG: hypothetical protein ACI8ZM_004179 [Crocinitomix sp.]|jgi:hypothetical protein